MTLKWSNGARAELLAADEYYSSRDPDFADRLAAEAEAAARFLAQHPQAGEAIDDDGLRKWRIKGTPFLFVYSANGREVRILHIVHAARDWRRFL